MANAQVEKFKALGIPARREGRGRADGRPLRRLHRVGGHEETLDMKPEELASQASLASANLVKQQPAGDVLAKLEKDGLVNPGFVTVVDNQLKNALKPDTYKAKLEWVTPEPGAGLIRDKPDLIAPTDLFAFPGRGGILMYALDDKKERVLDTGGDPKKKGKAKKAEKGEKPEDKKRREEEEERRKKSFAGTGKVDAESKEKAKEEVAADAATGPWKEETKGQRWVVISGVVDNEQLKKNYLMALKNPAVAYPTYKRVDVQRRQRVPEGGWTPWAGTEQEKNYDVLDNLPQLAEEVVPATMRIQALVDPLPFLQAGY